MVKKLCILHFNILEKYPPAMNFINDLESDNKKFELLAISSKNTTSYSHFSFSNGFIFRIGNINGGRLKRYFSYLAFNFWSLMLLVWFRPQEIVVFETLSIWPAYFYKKIRKQVNIHVHHHEYASLDEIEANSAYLNFLHRKEQRLFKNATFSHTNDDRRALYLKDHPNLISSKVDVYPNLPPQSWWLEYGSKRITWQGPKIKLVYVGALDLETMYVQEVVDWVLSNPDVLELTIISQQMNTKTRSYIKSKVGDQIRLVPPINYKELPNELLKYDIGVFMYKGVSKNHVFSVPNKVLEYLYCGLNVLGDSCLISTQKLNSKYIKLINFNSLNIPQSELINFVLRNVQSVFMAESLSSRYK